MSEEWKEKVKEEESHLPVSTEVRRLTPVDVVFEETEGNMLNAKVGDYLFERVQIHRSFPHSNPDRYLTVRTKENREVGLIEDLAEFPDDQKELLVRQMKLRYFSPVISHIIHVKDEYGYTHWVVDTDCGECRFTVRGGGGSVIQPTPNKYIITDVDGNRFILPDVTKLPVKEYRMIDIYL